MLSKLNKALYILAYTIVICALIAAGLRFAVLKNKHTVVKREIDKVERRTRDHNNLLNQYKADLQNSNNRFLLKDKIKSMHTDLVPLNKHDIVAIPSATNPRLVHTE